MLVKTLCASRLAGCFCASGRYGRRRAPLMQTLDGYAAEFPIAGKYFTISAVASRVRACRLSSIRRGRRCCRRLKEPLPRARMCTSTGECDRKTFTFDLITTTWCPASPAPDAAHSLTYPTYTPQTLHYRVANCTSAAAAHRALFWLAPTRA